MTISGTTGNDNLTGTSGNDRFVLTQGGNDTVNGAGGNDMFVMGGTLTPADAINGGAGNDTVQLDGMGDSDYIAFTATTLISVESLGLRAGFDYDLITNDATVAAGATLYVNGSELGSANSLTFDGSAETNGRFSIKGGLGNDTLTGGAGNDIFDLSHGGHDTVNGGGGNDRFTFAGNLDSGDRINGGDGNDTVYVQGDYTTGMLLGGGLFASVEKLVLGAGHNNSFTADDSLIAAGKTFTIDASALGAASRLYFNGTGETDGHYNIIGGQAPDVLIGGAASDTFDLTHGGNDNVTGAGGADTIVAGPGHDTFTYTAVGDSTSPVHDTIVNFDASLDRFDLNVSVTAYDGEISTKINASGLDAELTSATAGHLAAHGAIVVDATSGSLSGHLFLVVDANGTAGYQANADYVFDITGAAHLTTLATSNFI
jgi:Ca2+-binding RTX toxin-like protein